MNDIEEAAIYMFCNDYCFVLSLRPTAFFCIPIFDSTNYVSLIRLAKHNLDFEHRVVFCSLQKYIQPSTGWLTALLLNTFEVTQSKNRRIIPNEVL